MKSDIVKQLLEKRAEISWEKVFEIYEVSERPKWLEKRGDQMTSNHFKVAKELFVKLIWFEGFIRIKSLYPVNLVKNTGWVQRLACPNHIGGNCPNCMSLNPTLSEVVENIRNQKLKLSSKLLSIQSDYCNSKLIDPFAVLTDDQGLYVYDGNSRLISIASLPYTQNHKIKCYLGCTISS